MHFNGKEDYLNESVFSMIPCVSTKVICVAIVLTLLPYLSYSIPYRDEKKKITTHKSSIRVQTIMHINRK